MKTIVSALGLLAALQVGARGAQPDDVNALRDRLDSYLRAYEPQLSALVADELMTQRTAEGRFRDGTPIRVTNRRLASEVAFVSLPGSAGWLGFRHVINVNSKNLPDAGPPLAQLLKDGARDDIDRARLLLEQSAAHNLGAPRTTNLPNLPLELLHPRHRHRFAHRVAGGEKVRGVRTTMLVADEASSPSLIQSPDGKNLQSTVTAWIDDEGRLLRALVRSRDPRIGVPQFDNTVTVEFKADDTLQMLVPTEMRENFFVGRDSEGAGTAKYTNYRRFSTSARVVPPPP